MNIMNPANNTNETSVASHSVNDNNAMEQEKIKVFELDFGDTNFLSENPKAILDWIETELHDLKDSDELNYTITIRRMTQQEIDAMPEWS